MPTEPTEILSTLHFHTLLTSTPYLIADFYATWCPPCKTIAPLYAQLAAQHAAPGKLAFVKVNVDAQREVAAKWGVTAMPTFVLFKGGEKVGEVRGADLGGLRGVVGRAVEGVRGLVEREKSETAKEGIKEKVGDNGVKGEKEEEKTVSGSYGMTKGDGWKMSLR